MFWALGSGLYIYQNSVQKQSIHQLENSISIFLLVFSLWVHRHFLFFVFHFVTLSYHSRPMRFDQIAPPKVSMANNTCYQQIVSKQVLKIYKNEIWKLDSFLFTQNNLRNSAQKLLGISKSMQIINNLLTWVYYKSTTIFTTQLFKELIITLQHSEMLNKFQAITINQVQHTR